MGTKNSAVSGKLLFLSSSVAVLSAFAVHSGAIAATADAPPAPAPADAAPASSSQLQQVVVTAEKRETTVQRTPATVEVVSSKAIQQQHIVDLMDLNNVFNNTQIVPIASAMQVIIRGIGNDYVDPRADPSVAVTINGLFYARVLPTGFGFLDVSRVEDLSGPQGTLYGRGAAGGVLNIITNQPTNKFGGMVQATGGNLGENEFTGVLNVPITDDLDTRFAYDRDRRNGYLQNFYDDIATDTARASARWTPTSNLVVYGEANYNHDGGHGETPEAYPCGTSAPWSSFMPPSCDAFNPVTGGSDVLTGHESSWVQSDLLHVDYDLGFMTATSITGYVGTHLRNSLLPNGAYFTNTIVSDNNDYSEEIRFAGHDNASHQGGFAWQVGTYLFWSSGDYFQEAIAPGGLPPSGITTYSAAPQTSYAGYAQATYGLTDHLRITGGIRYTADSRGLTDADETLSGFVLGSGTAKVNGSKLTYKGALEYDVAPGHLLYASISTGYAAGGVSGGNPSAPLLPNFAPATFLPETITAYEIGSKNRFLDNRLQLNGDFYYYDFQNYQYLFPALVQGGAPFPGLQIQSLGPVTAYGVEFSAEYALTPDDTFSASLSLTHATFGPLDYATIQIVPPSTILASTEHLAGGSELVNDPPWSALLGYEHTWHLDESSSVTFNINSKLSDKYLLVVASTVPADYQRSYTMTAASVAYHWADDKYSVRVWVKNLEDSAVNIYGEGATFNLYGIEAPRTYGVTVTANF